MVFQRFWKAFTPAPVQIDANSTDGRIVYAIGDIHGHDALLNALLRKIATVVNQARATTRPIIVFLGDYIDRGPDAKRVVERLISLQRHNALEVYCLKGNHEQMLLRFYNSATVGPVWARYGGRATLESYGVIAPREEKDLPGWEAARLEFQRALPQPHLEFYNSLILHITVGDYFFVHAGVRPGVALDNQTEADLIWTKGKFLTEKRPFGKIIVHGHTTADEVSIAHNRIGVDTGAYATGVLSAIRLEGATQTVFDTSDAPWPGLKKTHSYPVS